MDEKPKPRARVRQVRDAEPLVLTPPKLKVRPFTECFDRGAGVPALVMRADIQHNQLLVSISGRDLVTLTGIPDRDGHGPFIVLDAQEHPVDKDHALRLDADARDGEDSHAALSYFELARDRAAREELDYAERWYSVYFNPLGLVDGTGSSGPRSLLPRPLPS